MGRGQDSAAYERDIQARNIRHRYLPPGIDDPEETIPGVRAAARDIVSAVTGGAGIAVFCDYDPDGTCAGEAVRLVLDRHVVGITTDPEQHAQVLFGYATARKGFGLDEDFVRQAADFGATTLITVDCGSASAREVALAQQLGMQVIVTDHHQIAADNSADHHLNPALHGPSAASGAIVAWKLALVLGEQLDDQPDQRLLGRGAWVAAFGARSDWMSMDGTENIALVALAAEQQQNVPPALNELAHRLGYNTVEDGFQDIDQFLNLAKRTPRADARDVAQILAADSVEEALPALDRLAEINDLSIEVLKRMNAQAAGQAEVSDDFAYAKISVPDGVDFTGHAGNVAHEVNVAHKVPALVLIDAGPDQFGQQLWRWAARNNDGKYPQAAFTDALNEIRAASTITVRGDDEQPTTVPSAGGHPKAVSGRCTDDRIAQLLRVFQDWAAQQTVVADDE